MHEMSSDTYILGLWVVIGIFQEVPIMEHLVTITRNPDNFLKWDGQSRIRIYEDDKIFNSKDKKEFRHFTDEGTEDTVLNHVMLNLNSIQTTMEELSLETEIKSLVVKGNIDKFQELAKECDFMHVKKVTREEFESMKCEQK